MSFEFSSTVIVCVLAVVLRIDLVASSDGLDSIKPLVDVDPRHHHCAVLSGAVWCGVMWCGVWEGYILYTNRYMKP